jgi:CRP-like cAMP-binding protein
VISLDFLEKADVFSELSDDQLNAVQGCCETADFKRGERLFNAGDDPVYLWIVVEGQVDLTLESTDTQASDSLISQLGPAMSFGWPSLVPPDRYRLSAVGASRSCRVLKVDAAKLRALFAVDAEAGYKVMTKVLGIISRRFYQLQDEVARRRGDSIINRW